MIKCFSPFNIFKSTGSINSISMQLTKLDELSILIKSLAFYFDLEIDYVYTKFNIKSNKSDFENYRIKFKYIFTDIKGNFTFLIKIKFLKIIHYSLINQYSYILKPFI